MNCNTPKIRSISAFRFRFIGLFTVGEGLDPPWDFSMENPIRRKANHNEIPSGNLRKSKIFAGRVKTLPYTSGVRPTLQTGILQQPLFAQEGFR